MKITDVRIWCVAPHGPEKSLAGSRIGWVFVEVVTDSGITGVGECSNWTRSSDLIVSQATRILSDSLIGRDPGHIEAIWHELFRNYTYMGNRGLITTVISGIDIALWDIAGKAAGKPVYELLGGPVRDDVAMYTHVGGGTPERYALHARELVAQGWKAMKTDPFNEMIPMHTHYRGGYISKDWVRAGAERIAAVRDAAGPSVEILIDAHGQYNVASAVQCIRALEPYDIHWFEEPVPPEGYDALRQIRDQTNVDICVGERLFTRWEFLPVFQQRLANYVMPDVCWTGGITELRKIASMAEAFFVPISPHNALGPIQILAGAHVCMTVPNFYRLEVTADHQGLSAPISPALDIRAGVLHLPDAPGLGVELDHEFIRAHLDESWR